MTGCFAFVAKAVAPVTEVVVPHFAIPWEMRNESDTGIFHVCRTGHSGVIFVLLLMKL